VLVVDRSLSAVLTTIYGLKQIAEHGAFVSAVQIAAIVGAGVLVIACVVTARILRSGVTDRTEQ
jgi:hypothetical protein